MKRTILLLLSVMMTVIMTAGDVTPQQALQQAQKFLQQTPSGMKRSQAEVPQLKMAGRISGLYVFNAEQNQGYVIVSNDDRTAPILGYSETVWAIARRAPSTRTTCLATCVPGCRVMLTRLRG